MTLRFIVACLFVALFLALSTVNSSAAQTVDAANTASLADPVELYRSGDYAGARALWLEELARPDANDDERARLCFNLGNAAFRAEEPLDAVAWYTASLRLRPRDADAWANLEFARNAAQLPPADRGDLVATTQRLLGSLTRDEARWCALAALLAWGVVLAFEALRGGRAWRAAAWTGFGLLLVACVPALWHGIVDGGDPLLAIEAPKALVRSEPRQGAAVIGEAEAGREVERIDELPNWTRVRFSSDAGPVEGWVPRASVFVLRR